MKELVFTLTLGAELVLGAVLVWSIARPGARIWPPPGRDSWQYRLGWVPIILAVGILDWNTFSIPHWQRLPTREVSLSPVWRLPTPSALATLM